SVTVTLFSFGASRPAVSMNDNRGRADPTRDSDTRESFGLLWIVHANDTRAMAPTTLSALTVTVEVPRRRGRPVILPLEELIERPAGRPAALKWTLAPRVSEPLINRLTRV